MSEKRKVEYLSLLAGESDMQRWLAGLRHAEELLINRTPIFLCHEVGDLRNVMEAALLEKLGESHPISHPWGHKALNPLGGYGEYPRTHRETEETERRRVGAAIGARLKFVRELLADLGAPPSEEVMKNG